MLPADKGATSNRAMRMGITSAKAKSNLNRRIRQGFDGTVATLAEVEAFTPRELFAWHIHDAIITIPVRYRYTQIEILNARHISPDEIEYGVRLSGVKASPSMKEESFYRVVRENGQWKIDQ